MIPLLRRLFPAVVATFAVVVSCPAQYEQLLAQPEPAPETPSATSDATPAEPAVPEPRLLAPSLHREQIAFLDQSADRDYLLTGDRGTLRLWDVAHRANLVTLTATLQPQHDPFTFAAFVGPRHDLLVHAGSDLRLYTGLPGSVEFEKGYASRNTRLHYHRASNTIVQARFEPANPRLLRLGLSEAVAGLPSRRIELNLHNAYRDHAFLNLHPDHPISLDASGRLLALRFTHGAPLAVIHLPDGELITTVPSSRHPLGLLPNGKVLLMRREGPRHVFETHNPVTAAVEPAFELVYNDHITPFLPSREGDPLLLRSGPRFFLHDLATGKTSQQLEYGRRIADGAIQFRAKSWTRPLVAMSQTTGSDTTIASTHLEFIDPVAGVSRGPWVTETFASRQLFPRADDFEFVAQRGHDLRRVRLNEAGLLIEPLRLADREFRSSGAFYDADSDQWRVVGAGNPALAQPASGSAPEYIAAPIGVARRNDDNGTTATPFYRTSGSVRSRDGRFLALHHSNGVQVVALPSGKTVAAFTEPESTWNFDRPCPGLALAPDGSAVVFTYTFVSGSTHSYRTECRELPSGTLRWKVDGLSGPFAFSPDAARLYTAEPNNHQLGSVLYADTGEVASRLANPGSYGKSQIATFNPAGTLLAAATATAIDVVSLPGGERIARLPLNDRPTALEFIGSDRFLIANAANDEVLRLFDLKERTAVAELYLFESPQKWVVRHPQTGLFSSETSVQDDLHFAVGDQITPLASYFDEYYRPRLLGSLIKGLAPRPPVPLAELRHAPRLTLAIAGPNTRGLSVEDEFETREVPNAEVTLQLNASCEGSPITDLRIYHNGKLVAGATRGLFVEDDDDAPPENTFTKTASHTFTLTPGKNRFRAVAINQQGTESVPDEIVVYSAAAPPLDDTAGIALHVVTVGIDAYRNPAYNLNYARADATAVETVLRERLGQLFTRAHHYALYDAEATRENILATLETVKREAGPRDVFVFYYAGHGVMSDDEDPEFYLAPHEITQLYGERRVLRQLGIPGRDLLDYSRDIAAQKQLFILDACQSAGALKQVAVRGAVEERAIAQLARSTGTHWLTATGSEQFAAEFARLGHGAFTHVLLEALNGAADAGDGIVSVNELKAYLEARVPELTAAEKGEAQYPVTYGYGQDFPLTIVQP